VSQKCRSQTHFWQDSVGDRRPATSNRPPTFSLDLGNFVGGVIVSNHQVAGGDVDAFFGNGRGEENFATPVSKTLQPLVLLCFGQTCLMEKTP